jgi:Family of unknown function (DUF6535)
LFSLESALIATLSQQWASRCIQLPKKLVSQTEQARVRSHLLFGTQKYPMPQIAEMSSALGLSLLLFFAGLVIFFFCINKTVATVIFATVGPFVLTYVYLSVLHFMFQDCPYGTAESNVLWQSWYSYLSFTVLCIRWLLKQIRGGLERPNPGEITSRIQGTLVEWINFSEKVAKESMERYSLPRSIIKGALKAPVDVDVKALAWLFKLPAFADQNKVQEYLADVPGEMVVQVMNDPVHFRARLYALLQSCASPTAGLDEKGRKSRLLICLNAIYHVARASIIPYKVTLSTEVTPSTQATPSVQVTPPVQVAPPTQGNPSVQVAPCVEVLRDFHIDFANMGLMRTFWADSDPAIRVISRSICALFAGHLLGQPPLMDSQLAWLQDMLGLSLASNTISSSDLARVNSMNIGSFVYGVLSNQSDNLLNDQVFVETLRILMKARNQTDPRIQRNAFKAELSALLQREKQKDHCLHVLFYKLKEIFEHFFPSDERDVTNANEVRCLWSTCSIYVARSDNSIPVRQLNMTLLQYRSTTL